MVPEIFLLLIDGNPTVSIAHVLVIVAVDAVTDSVTADAAAVTDLDVVKADSGVTIHQTINISGTILPTQFVLTFFESQEQADKHGGCY